MKDSAYNLCIRDRQGRYGLFNTRTGAAQLLEDEDYQSYWAAANGEAPSDKITDMLRQLVHGGFVVDDDVDEFAAIEAEHLAARTSRDRLGLVIAPSMACNLDCFYCFESNRYPGRMSEETQSRLMRLVRDYLETGTKQLAVTWYGGEPLLALAVMERLSAAFLASCADRGCAYSAEIVTNGTLLTSEKAERLAAFQVGRAQITLDGLPALHNERRVAKDRKPTFGRILDAIEAASAYMHVSVRINACRNVAQGLEELLQLLAARGLNRKASVYLAPLREVPGCAGAGGGDARRAPPAPQRRDPQIDYLSSRAASELTLRFHGLLHECGFAVHPSVLPQPRRTACMGDRDHSWLIEANGNVQKCYWTAGLKSEAVGHLAPQGIMFQTPSQKWQSWNAFRRTDCAGCIMLPLCLGLCPLRQLAGEPDYCPAFRHDWQQVLAQAFGFSVGQVRPVDLPLTGKRLKPLAIRDLAGPT